MVSKQKKEETIFKAAIKLNTPEERVAYVDQACGNDAVLRARIAALFRVHEENQDILAPIVADVNFIGPSSSISETPGTVIGRYKLLEKIGEGGMAVVHMAEQERPVRRKVALKIIKLGMDTRQVIARFEAERQALALMDHPHIAKVLDAGATDTGRPYFVMELVQGVSITDYCDHNSLSTKERLDLFIQVCQTVQHAHQKGIIHRDIKPTNVMVTQRDGTPVPKVIDFGIAKATNQRLTEKTLFTRYAHIIGTPAYMSPEQAELSDIDIDTRSDIYSLGVLLYELLTGTTPFSEEELRKVGYAEMTRVIREQDPVKPSTRLSSCGDTLADIAKSRNVGPEVLLRTLRGDLDWIVMKTLEKDRTRRYETANAFALDVQRYLDSEPVLARGPSASYQLQKFLCRHRIEAMAVLALTAVGLVMGVILHRWNQDRARLVEAQSIRAEADRMKDQGILSQARAAYDRGDRQGAQQVRTILNSPYVGPDAQFLHANMLVDLRDYDKALDILKSLVDERPEIAAAAHGLWVKILLESQSFNEETRKDVETHQSAAEALLPQTQSAEAYYLRARTSLTIKEKLESLDQALSLDSSHYESRRLRAYIYYASRQYDGLRDDAVAMTVRRPRDPLGHALYAAALRAQGEYDKAIASYDSAIRCPTVDDAQLAKLNAERCEVLMEAGQYERVVTDAQAYLKVLPQATRLRFQVFCALCALGRYEQARSLFKQHIENDAGSNSDFQNWSRKYVFDTLEAGVLWHAKDSQPRGSAFLPLWEAQETYQTLSAKARRVVTDGFTAHYSPDGQKLAYSTGFHGYSGVAVLDRETGRTDLLIVPGKDPQWSPDGQYLVFVRDCNVLPVSELANAAPINRHRDQKNEEVWVMKADGTEPRRVGFGSLPCWDRDPDYIYYYSSRDATLYKANWQDPHGIPQPIQTKGYPLLSTDRNSLAYIEETSFEIFDLASESVLTKYKLPFKPQGEAWSRHDGELCFGASVFGGGLWIYDLETESTKNVLQGPIRPISVSWDGTKLVFNIKSPYFEIWEADLDPGISVLDSLGPGKTLDACRREEWALHAQRIQADPNNAHNYFLRAQFHDSWGERQRAQADMHRWSDLAGGEPLVDSVSPIHKQVINLPNEYQLVFSAERPTDSISMMSIAFGQKGRSKMKHFKMPTWVASLGSLSLILGLYAQPVYADYEFGTAENLGPLINSADNEWYVRLHLDELSLIVYRNTATETQRWLFTRTAKGEPWDTGVRTDTLPKEEQGGGLILPGWSTIDGLELVTWGPLEGNYGGYDLYTFTRESIDIAWMECELVNLGPVVNTSNGEALATISADGLELYFSDWGLHRPGGYGEEDLWVTRRATRLSPWETPENLGSIVNSPSNDSRAHISIDGLRLFFDSRRPGGYGGSDLYVARRRTLSDPWGPPVNLGPQVNSSGNEWSPCISPDGRELYFSRDEDIWRAPINPVVDMDGSGQVNAADMSILVNHWHTGDPLCDIGPMPWGDGRIDEEDLKVLSEYLEPGFGRIAHWKLDESEGDIAYDSIGSDHANVHGEAAWQPDAGIIDGALTFDGVDDYIAPMTILNPQDKPFRILAWIKGGAPGQVIASQTPAEFTPGWTYLAVDPADGSLITDLILPNMPLDSEVVITDDEWHEVGLEWDGQRRHLLVNGDQAVVDEVPLPALDCTGYLNIGTGKDMEPGSFWAGLMDEVRVYVKGG